MGNQQLTPLPTDLAYLAGIIDGEGSLAAHRNGNKKGLWYTPRLSIYNTDLQLIEWCRDVLAELGAGSHIGSHVREHGRRVQYVLTIQRLKALRVCLPHIIPFLKQKRFRGELLLEFCERREDRRTPYEPRDLDIVAMLFDANGDKRNNAQTVREAASRLKRQSTP